MDIGQAINILCHAKKLGIEMTKLELRFFSYVSVSFKKEIAGLFLFSFQHGYISYKLNSAFSCQLRKIKRGGQKMGSLRLNLLV